MKNYIYKCGMVSSEKSYALMILTYKGSRGTKERPLLYYVSFFGPSGRHATAFGAHTISFTLKQFYNSIYNSVQDAT